VTTKFGLILKRYSYISFNDRYFMWTSFCKMFIATF